MKKVFTFLAEGFEEVEALMVVDLLRRTKSVEVIMVSITDELVVSGVHDIKVVADKTILEIDFASGDVIFLPGGVPGTPNLAANNVLIENIIKYNNEGKFIAAICAAPSILGELGLLKGRKATCYPGYEDKLLGAEHGGKVIVDGNIITGKAMATALEMGLEMISVIAGPQESRKIAAAIQYE